MMRAGLCCPPKGRRRGTKPIEDYASSTPSAVGANGIDLREEGRARRPAPTRADFIFCWNCGSLAGKR